MEKNSVYGVLRMIFCRSFAFVGLTALIFLAFSVLSQMPDLIEKAILSLCFGGIF
jgi:hypothetical protein